jgi:hypothetical protein
VLRAFPLPYSVFPASCSGRFSGAVFLQGLKQWIFQKKPSNGHLKKASQNQAPLSGLTEAQKPSKLQKTVREKRIFTKLKAGKGQQDM